ncbi:MAG: CPBP family intramembrane metalloprotease [Ruminococcaceae bacterium]|nr:CPBP family intramembrane metalloprotease [Oscillospiraceae bacterium]
MSKRRIPTWLPFAVIGVAAPLLLWIEYGPPMTQDAVLLPLMQMTLTRTIAAAVFLVILLSQGYRVLNPLRAPFGKSLLWSLPAFAVVINNMPILSMMWGDAYIVHGGAMYWVWFALECLAIGLFEEIAFRGVILLRFAQTRRATHKGLLISILLSSAVFGAMHAVNLFAGAGPGAVLMQIGYSFLIGAMCSVVLFKTANLWLCVALHAIYDFCGALLPTLGAGHWWDTPTVIFTAVLAVATTVYMVVLFARMDPRETDRIYAPSAEKHPE